jgi:hypothetical protein
VQRGTGLLFLVLGYIWIALWAASVIGACTMNGLKGGDALGFLGRTQDFFSPTNLANWITILIAGSPGLGAVWLGRKLRPEGP